MITTIITGLILGIIITYIMRRIKNRFIVDYICYMILFYDSLYFLNQNKPFWALFILFLTCIALTSELVNTKG